MDSSEITEILDLIAAGESGAQERLLDSVYCELHRLAQIKMANEKPGHTLQPTALVNETYLKLFGASVESRFHNRAHFFGAAAEAMRRILVDRARRSRSLKRGGDRDRVPFENVEASIGLDPDRDAQTIAVSEALVSLESRDPRAALIVKLRYFVGLTLSETADSLDLAPSTVSADWTTARAWLRYQLQSDDAGQEDS